MKFVHAELVYTFSRNSPGDHKAPAVFFLPAEQSVQAVTHD